MSREQAASSAYAEARAGLPVREDSGRIQSTHSPASAAFYTGSASNAIHGGTQHEGHGRGRRPPEERRRVQGPDFVGRQAAYGLPYWPVREGYTLSIWVCMFPSESPTGTADDDVRGHESRLGDSGPQVSELSAVLDMRMPIPGTGGGTPQDGEADPRQRAGRRGVGARSLQASDRNGNNFDGRPRANTIGDSQQQAPSL